MPSKKAKNLVWVYPLNTGRSDSKKTFVYGYSNPKANLYVQVGTCRGKSFIWKKEEKVKVFSNGNFAQNISLIKKSNKVRLIQEIKGKRKTITRSVEYNRSKKSATSKRTKKIKVNTNTLNPESRILNPTIVIDPGHGGKEHGTHDPRGIPESKYNLEIAKLLYEKLKKKNKKVFLTRSKDKYVSLKDRVEFARKKKADILVSIHHNALPDNENPLKHKGAEVYYLHNSSKLLASLLLKNLVKSTKLKSRGVIRRDFALTRPDFCKAVLIECGFLIHPEESDYITKKSTQKKIVDGIVSVLK